jgi:RimJ/RimL family protein N-acetyltransferase
VDLRPFDRDHLPLVDSWFQDPETQRWLGGPDWPRMMLDLSDALFGEFRGAQETGCYRFLAWDKDVPVGYVDCGTFDRWTTWEGGAEGRGVVGVIDEPSGAIAYVIDPAQRRKGYGAEMILALIGMDALDNVTLFAAGIEPENTASVRCLLSAGFRPLDPVRDWEGIVYYARRARNGRQVQGFESTTQEVVSLLDERKIPHSQPNDIHVLVGRRRPDPH